MLKDSSMFDKQGSQVDLGGCLLPWAVMFPLTPTCNCCAFSQVSRLVVTCSIRAFPLHVMWVQVLALLIFLVVIIVLN